MRRNDVFLAVLRAASTGTDGHEADELRRIVAAWIERQRRRTEISLPIGWRNASRRPASCTWRTSDTVKVTAMMSGSAVTASLGVSRRIGAGYDGRLKLA